MGLTLRYSIDGADRAEHELVGIAARAVESRPLLEAFAGTLREREARRFDTEGEGEWPPLAASTLERKRGPRILEESGLLRGSLTGGAEHVETIIGSELLFGTSVDYAVYHRTGTSRMPKRDPLVQPDEALLVEFTRDAQAWIMGAERATYGAPSFGLALLSPFGL